ncbi:MAG: hypothetical protein H0W30_16790 [Gemmatimonadaceae bacterium]|nr:hypothetical protein [Gemmatimonadaceae bacterium]
MERSSHDCDQAAVAAAYRIKLVQAVDVGALHFPAAPRLHLVEVGTITIEVEARLKKRRPPAFLIACPAVARGADGVGRARMTATGSRASRSARLCVSGGQISSELWIPAFAGMTFSGRPRHSRE